MILIGTLVLEMEYAMLEIMGEFQHVLRFVKALMVVDIFLYQRLFHAMHVSFPKLATTQFLQMMTTKYTKCKKVFENIKTKTLIFVKHYKLLPLFTDRYCFKHFRQLRDRSNSFRCPNRCMLQ